VWRKVNEKHFRYNGKIQQIHGIRDQADMREKFNQYLRAFFNTFKFRQEKKTAETFNEDPEDFCEKKIRRPVNVDNNIANNYPNDKTDIS
jgi:hypothetical protein